LVAAGENGRHPASVSSEHWMPDGVDAGMDSMQTSRIKSMFDCAATEAEIEQLSARDHMMLRPS
jgi:hypothetical protein